MRNKIEFTDQITWGEFRRVFYLSVLKKLLPALLLAGTVLTLAGLLILSRNGMSFAGSLALSAALTVLYLALAIILSTERILRLARCGFSTDSHIVICDNTFEHYSEREDWRLDFSVFTKVAETGRYLMLHISETQYIFIRRRAFPSRESYKEFLREVKAHIAAGPRQ